LTVCGSHTAFSQDTTKLKCFTFTQQKEILKKFDSLNTYKVLVFENEQRISTLLEDVLRGYKNQREMSSKIDELNRENNLLADKVARRNRILTVSILANGTLIYFLFK
jgi:hypothetical protein